MKPTTFQRTRDDSELEAAILNGIQNGEFSSEDFGPNFSMFTSSVIFDISEVPSCFDGCAAERLVADERVYHISGDVFWLGDSIADHFRFDLDRSGTGLYSWKFFRYHDFPEQVLYVARMSDCWKYSATFS